MGGLLLTLERRKGFWRSLLLPLAAWTVVAVVFSDVWRIVMPPNLGEHGLRVVTFNTAGAMLGAIREVAPMRPDIVLLQESADLPDEKEVLRDELGADYEGVFGLDASIFVRGKIVSVNKRSGDFTFAHVKLKDGREMDVVSLRMQAPHVRLDYWSADCWRNYTVHREQHLEELAGIWESVKKLRTGSPMVLGGDFNLVPDSREPEILGPDLTDSFRAAGRGWYATALSSVLLFRIDQVWCSSDLRPQGTWASNSRVSDHRYVVAQFDWK